MCAAIDKTYTTSWKEYQEVVKWASENKFTCPNGIVLYPIEYTYTWEEESFDGSELPILNTSNDMDYFLIKYCPIELVQNRMKEVYAKEYIEAIKNGTSAYDTFTYPEMGTRLKMIKDSRFHSKRLLKWTSPYSNRKYTNVSIGVRYKGQTMWYNTDINAFLLPYELGEWSCNIVDLDGVKSLKTAIRRIRKWKLPKGAIVEVTGRYVEETWKFKVI